MVGFMGLQRRAPFGPSATKTRGGGGHVTELANRPALKYAGFALLLAWHYALWFVPTRSRRPSCSTSA